MVWVSEIFINLIMPCLLNRCGGCYIKRKHWCLTKYFPSGNILDAIIHPRCSYTWRSILQARDVINRGAVWRVGDGSTIDVWGHRWLTALDHDKVISPRLDSPIVHVKDLFYPGTRIWDPGLLERISYCGKLR